MPLVTHALVSFVVAGCHRVDASHACTHLSLMLAPTRTMHERLNYLLATGAAPASSMLLPRIAFFVSPLITSSSCLSLGVRAAHRSHMGPAPSLDSRHSLCSQQLRDLVRLYLCLFCQRKRLSISDYMFLIIYTIQCNFQKVNVIRAYCAYTVEFTWLRTST